MTLMLTEIWMAVALVALQVGAAGDVPGPPQASGQRQCVGAYAPTVQAISAAVARYENEPGHSFVYCLRTVATYEQAYYGRDGRLKKRMLRATAHGTGFGYRQSGSETYLLTNHHVSSWPEVTEEDGQVRGVPAGARRVSEQLFIVRNDEDDYEPGFIPLSEVAADPSLDATVVKARRPLNVMPYAVGSSAALKNGDAVEVRGYPLGAFAAANVGKVTNPFVEDTDKDWNHADFALDALVNRGNSGSPVLAVNCATGEYELVGLFHAGYRGGQAMNLAVGIDEVRPLMDLLAVRPRMARAESPALTLQNRMALADAVRSPLAPLSQVRFGDRLVSVSVEDDARLVFRLHGAAFPADPYVWTELREPLTPDDHPPEVRVSTPLVAPYNIPSDALDAEAREHLERITSALVQRLWRVEQYREAVGPPPRSKDQHKRSERMLKELARTDSEGRELVEGLDGHLERARMMWLSDGGVKVAFPGNVPDENPAASTVPRVVEVPAPHK